MFVPAFLLGLTFPVAKEGYGGQVPQKLRRLFEMCSKFLVIDGMSNSVKNNNVAGQNNIVYVYVCLQYFIGIDFPGCPGGIDAHCEHR